MFVVNLRMLFLQHGKVKAGPGRWQFSCKSYSSVGDPGLYVPGLHFCEDLRFDAVDEELNGIKSQILTEMESRNVKTWITDGGIKLTRKLPTTRTSLNLTLLKEAHPEIDYEQYMRESQVSSSLTITV